MPLLQLHVYTQFSTPIYAGKPFTVKAGFYDIIGGLNDVTADTANLSWVVLDNPGVVVWTEPGQIKPVNPGSCRIRFTYNSDGTNYTYDYSFCAIVPEPSGLTSDQAYACLKREEPPEAYTESTDPLTSLTYNDNRAFSDLISELYVYLNAQANNIFPEKLVTPSDGTVQQWELMLTGTYNLLNPNSSRTPAILQFIRNAGFTFNPYDLAFWVSEYIWLKLAKNTFVYIEETLIPYSNKYWLLDISQLGVNTYLGPAGNPLNRSTAIIHVLNYDYIIDKQTQAEILFLIGIWGMCGITYEIDYGHHPSAFGLVQNLGNTYKGDPRTIGIYCLQYNTNAVQKVYGLTNPYALSKLQSIQIIPASGTFYVGNTINYTVQGEYLFGYTQDITSLCSFTSTTPETMSQGTPGNIYSCINPGPGQVTASYWYFTSASDITIEPFETTNWTLNVSQLGIDTTLA